MVSRTAIALAAGSRATQSRRSLFHNWIKRRHLPLRQSYMRMRIAMILLLACVSGRPAHSDSATDVVIYQVESHYNSAKTLSVDFTENYSILGHRRPPESGTLTLRKAGKMRWDYRQPPGKLFLSDGKSVYLFTARDNRVEKVALKATDDLRAPLAFLLGRLDMKKEFREITARAADGGTWLLAHSRLAQDGSDRLPYQSIEMFVTGSGHIDRLLIHGRDQSTTSYSFENEKLNPPVNDAIFHFQIPAGAQVVDALETRLDGDH